MSASPDKRDRPPFHLYGNALQAAKIFYWFTAVILLSLIAGIFVTLSTDNAISAQFIAASVPLVLASFLFIRREKFEWAAISLAATLISLLTVLATFGQGIHQISNLGFPVTLIVASLVTRKRTMVFLTILTIGCVAWLVFGELTGLYQPAPLVRSVPGDFVSVSIIVLITAFVSRFLMGNLFEKNRQLQKELMERKLAEENYRNIVENSIDGIFQSTPDGKLMNVNWALARMYGYSSPGEMIHAITDISSQIYASPEMRDALRLKLEAEGSVTGFESLDYRRDGSTFWTSANIRVVTDRNGNTHYYEGTVEDITPRKQVEEALRESKERFRSVFENAAIGLYRITPDGKILLANTTFARMLGCKTADELMQRDRDGDSRVAIHDSFLQDIKSQGEVRNFEARWTAADGSILFVRENAKLIRGQNGEPLYIEGTVEDITERRQAEMALHKNQQRLQAFFNQSLDGFFFCMFDEPQPWENSSDREKTLNHIFTTQRYTDVNNAMLEQYGMTREQFLSLTSSDIFAHDPQQGLQLRRQLFDQGHLHLETNERKSDGAPVWFEGDYVCMYDEQKRITGFFAIQRDITDRKNAEAEREKLIRELESKNAELERFTYTVSHDLKSPLVTINGFLGYLKSDTSSGNLSRVGSDIQRIQDAVDKMHLLLRELLELSRIGRIMNPPGTIPFVDLVNDAMELVHGRLDECGATVQLLPPVGTHPGLPAVYGDRQRLVEVLQNLIDNAAKYMGNQPDPRIEIGQRGGENNQLIFFVRDNGIGIEAEHHERIFGLFNKLDARSEGTGVGLALVKRIIEVHGGRVWVESVPGQGSTFYFTLPKLPA